ncbi:MAG: LptF/LptG family permease [Candidatus Latescibacteria bacterium]|nr:LptF/LptG family permease [Candidatus Latescibacterota bacterium]
MPTLSRYVLKEHALPFALGFALILFVLLLDVVLQTMDQVLSKGLLPLAALQLLLFNLAWIVALAVPMAVLIAVLMTFARLAADGEIIAAKACGISFFALLRPVLAAAAVLQLLMVAFNDRVLPDWNHQARILASSLQRTKAALVLKEKEGVFIPNLGNYHLLVRRIDPQTNELSGITVYDASRPGPPVVLHAPRGRVELFGDGSYVRLELADGHMQRIESSTGDRFLHGAFTRQVLHIKDPRRRYERRNSSFRSDREMDIATMRRSVLERRREQQRARARLDSTVARYLELQAGMPDEMATGDLVDTTEAPVDLDRVARETTEEIRKQWRLIDNRAARINEFEVEIHKKFSIPTACLVFALVGAPLGALIRRRGAAVSVGVSLFFFWIYWMFLIGGEELADRGFIPPTLAMWAPNIVFALAGWGLLRLVAYDRAKKAG